MKIGDVRPPARPDRIRESGAARKPGTVQSTGAARQTMDTASVMGIPEAELTPKVREAIMTLMEEVDRLRRDLESAQRRIAQVEQIADQDPLAPIANRRAFVRELSRTISFADRYNAPASLLYFDVNGFKKVNDTYGHAVGDAALVHVAKLLVENVRESDVVGRLGGDEFGVVLANADQAAATEKAERLTHAIETTPFEWEGASMKLGVAYGVYTIGSGLDAGQALAEADRAMYAHKRRMRGETDEV